MSTPYKFCKRLSIVRLTRFAVIALTLISFSAIASSQAVAQTDVEQSKPEEPAAESETAPVEKNWRAELGVFRVGTVVGNNSETETARMEPFRLALEEALQMRVELFPARNYRALIEALAASRVEYAILSATGYATAWVNCECIEPLVVPKASDGTAQYQPVLIARVDQGTNLSAIAAGEVTSVMRAGSLVNLLAISHLREAGLSEDTASALAGDGVSGEAALEQFVSAKKNVILGWSSLSGDLSTGYSRGTLNLIAKDKKAGPNPIENIRIIWKGPVIPHRPHIVRSALPAQAKTILRSRLSNMYEADPVAYDSIEPVFGGGYLAARSGQFQPLIDLVAGMKKTPTAPEAPDQTPNKDPDEGQDKEKPRSE